MIFVLSLFLIIYANLSIYALYIILMPIHYVIY